MTNIAIYIFPFGSALGTLLAMNIQPKYDLLTILRHNVRYLEEDSGEDLNPDASETKAILLRRISVIEAAIARIAELTPPGPPKIQSQPPSGRQHPNAPG